MDKTTYQQELQEVRYTDAGRAALVEQLMAAQTAAEEPAGRSGRRKNWGRRGAVVLLAAVLLVTAAAAATAPLWMRYFGGLDEQQQAVVDAMQTIGDGLPPAAEGGGVTITPISILGSGNQLYITLEIRVPEGVVFSTEKGRYDLMASARPREVTEMASYTSRFTVLEAGMEAPNVLTGVYEVTSSCDLGGGTLEVRGLSLWKDRGEDEWILEGEWNIPLPEDITGKQVLEPKVEGVAVETEHGTFTLDAVSVSPLGLWWQYRFDGTNEPVIYTALKMKDGSLVEPAPGQMILGHPGGNETATASFAKPVDLAQAVSLYLGNMEIPLNGQEAARVDKNVPVISDEPAFYDLPADGGQAGESEPAAQPETGKETELRKTDTGLTAASKPDSGEELTEFQQQRDECYLRTLSLSDCEMIHNEPVTDEFVYQEAPYGEVRFGIDYLTFAEDGYARVSYWSHADETCILAVYKDENGGTWGRAFRVPEELLYTEN
ncbi:hypothetical protein [uncultured Dysosmobacter sp.]|uniref:hypothetical protein n=1 Tax=uncultured Dysosmobacter sp. TaxID=2591384 RepID=UPI00261EF9A1|nr:hypothetical protein [uncultured Dysosmobacter sp.]